MRHNAVMGVVAVACAAVVSAPLLVGHNGGHHRGEKYAKRVRDDFRGGIRSGVNGTPTFFINDVRYNSEHTLEAMLPALENAVTGK